WIDRGAPSDYLFWLRACARVPVVLLPADLFWYRVHAGQEFQSPVVARQYAEIVRDTWAALGDATCPLEGDERDRARRNVLASKMRSLGRDRRGGGSAVAAGRFAAGPAAVEWLRQVGMPPRDPAAGTPPTAEAPRSFAKDVTADGLVRR